MKDIERFDTFVTNPGSLEARVHQVTGLIPEQLAERMKQKEHNITTEVLIENPCNQQCPGCFFTEKEGKGLVRITPEIVNEIRIMYEVMNQTKPYKTTFYPREITTAMELLPMYVHLGRDRVLTNGKLIHKPGMIEQLKQAGIKRMSITVPGSRESYAIYTGEPADSFDQLLDNVSLAARSGFNVSIFMPVFSVNRHDIRPTIDDLYARGIREIRFLRLIPNGKAQHLSDDMFLTDSQIIEFLETVNTARHDYEGKGLRLALFGGYFGLNFYAKSIFHYLSGGHVVTGDFQSRYYCPLIGQQFIGVSLGSRDVFGCFQGMSFDEFKIGSYDGEIHINRNPIQADTLSQKLTGICASGSCGEQPLCLGSCRMVAFTNAKKAGHPDPMNAGQDFCITDFLRELQK